MLQVTAEAVVAHRTAVRAVQAGPEVRLVVAALVVAVARILVVQVPLVASGK